jgi:large subunit ribosomal protein L15
MRLHDLSPRHGAKRPRKRIGRGEASGQGKTSGRGHKGQMSRSGGKNRIGFEGGQMPLVRRLPKRGFSNAAHRISYLPVNVTALNQFKDATEVTLEDLKKAGLTNGTTDRIKILGQGELNRKLTVNAHSFSESAKAKIEGKGGECRVITRNPAKKEFTQKV